MGGGEGGAETSPTNPNCFAWCVMNLCISKQVQQVVRRMVACVGLEVLGKESTIACVCISLHVLYRGIYIYSCMYHIEVYNMHTCTYRYI